MLSPVPGVHRRRDPDDARVAPDLAHHAPCRRPACTAAAPCSTRASTAPRRRRRSSRAWRRARLHALEAALLGRREALALHGGDVDDDGPVGRQRLAQGAPQARHVVAVDDAGVGPVELLPEQARRPEGLQRLLQLRAEALEGRADAAGQLGEPVLDALAGVPQLRVQAHAVEVARQRADVRRDRHPVVVEDDDDRRAQAAGLVDRLEGDAAGHGAVADDGDDLARRRARRAGACPP